MDLNGPQIASGIGVAMMLLLMIHRLVVVGLPRKSMLWMVLLWGLIVVVSTMIIILLQPAIS